MKPVFYLCAVFLYGAAFGSKPNVLLILADDLGYGDLSCYGATKVETPNIDRLAREGVRFTDAHSASSVCTPTRYNLLTGRHAWRTWAKSSTVWAYDPLLVDPDRLTLADLFKQQGYATACLGKWHLGFGSVEMEGWDDRLGPDYNGVLKPGPLELGFDYFWGFPHVGQRPHFIVENHRVLNLDPSDPIKIIPDLRPKFYTHYLKRPRTMSMNPRLETEGGTSALYRHEDLSNRLTDRAVNYLQEGARDQPFFLYLAHRNIHGPLIPDPRFNDTSEIGKRGDFIHEFDYSVGRVLDALNEYGLEENTLVIFTSDNGGVLRYEPIDYPEINGHRINGPLRGQKGGAYEGGNRVPFIARWPGRIPNGSENTSLIALTDLIATFADYFEVDLPHDAGEDSFSFLGALLDQQPRQVVRQDLINDSSNGIKALRKGPWKLIPAQHGGRGPAGIDPTKPAGLLFNLNRDFSERTNEYDNYPHIVAELTALLERYQRESRIAPINRLLSTWE